MTDNQYLSKELKYFFYTFKRQPLLIKKGKGSFVWDEKGKKYFDFYSGLAVCGVGHNNDRVIRAARQQASQLLHCSNFFYTQPQMDLAKQLTARFPSSKVFFSNTGAEANEFAIKLARLWATTHKKPGRDIVTLQNGFHGRTLATTAASSWGRGTSQLFKPLPTGFRSAKMNDLKSVKKAINKNTIAVLMEPIQGEGGIQIADRAFLRGVAALCRQKKILLILDEVQSGMGRTGTFFAHEQYGVRPDIVTLAKGLAGGLPLGATLAKQAVAKLVQPGMHGSTFGGNPVSCAASLEVLKLLTSNALKSIQSSGSYIKQRLADFTRYPSVKSIRGKGLLLAIELHKDGAPYVALARRRGLLINCTQKTVLRFLPPYFMKRAEVDRCIALLHSIFKTLN